MANLTDIKWIGKVKRTGDEYSTYEKRFTLSPKNDPAILRLSSDGISVLYINGKFVDGLAGRLPGRVGAYDVTKLLVEGENTVTVLSGGHFYESERIDMRKKRGVYFSRFALELDCGTTRIVSDESWTWFSDIGNGSPECFTNVTQAAYDRFWASAAVWSEYKPNVDDAIFDVAGVEYRRAVNTDDPELIVPKLTEITETYAEYDFGRVCVGFFELEYESAADCEATFVFDYSESHDDLIGAESWWRGIVGHMTLHEKLQKGSHTLFITRRRATHLMRINFPSGVKIKQLVLHSSIKPCVSKGFFRCNDDLLNRIWDVGSYTVNVNRHQEYESCPRQEMKFFIGDGVPDALTDYYAFGDYSLADSSLSYIDSVDAAGLVFDKLQISVCLMDYPAWRIIMVYNHYVYTGNADVAKKYYPELKKIVEWMYECTNAEGLIFQYPIQHDPFFMFDTANEYNSSSHRFGEKPYLNALYYRSLVCMSKLAELCGDTDASHGYAQNAENVKKAFNEHLWSNEAEAYLDTFDTGYIPQDGNTLAVLFGLADKERTRKIFKTMERELWSPYGSPVVSKVTNPDFTAPRCNNEVLSPMMNGYEAEARFLNGDAEGAIKLIKACWGTMIAKGAETFWEFAPKDATTRWPVSAHAWSGSCTYLLSAYVGGIRPAQMGFETVLFAPCGIVNEYRVVVPTPHGLIAASCVTEKGKQHYSLCLPSSLKLETNLPDGAELDVVKY